MRKATAVAGIVAACLVAVVVFVVVRSTDPPGDPAGGEGTANGAGPGDHVVGPPHCGGKQVMGLETALAEAPYSVTLPDSTLVSADMVAGVWDCPGDTTRIEFSTGLTLSLQRNTIKDPAASWERLARDDPTTTSVGDINGSPANLIDPETDPTHTAEGAAVWVVNGVHVVLIGNGKVPLAEIVTAAEALSIDPQASQS
jgi:hypothetical protein